MKAFKSYILWCGNWIEKLLLCWNQMGSTSTEGLLVAKDLAKSHLSVFVFRTVSTILFSASYCDNSSWKRVMGLSNKLIGCQGYATEKNSQTFSDYSFINLTWLMSHPFQCHLMRWLSISQDIWPAHLFSNKLFRGLLLSVYILSCRVCLLSFYLESILYLGVSALQFVDDQQDHNS